MSSFSLRLAAQRLPTAAGRRAFPPYLLRSFSSTTSTMGTSVEDSSLKSESSKAMPPHLLTLADLSTAQIQTLIGKAATFKSTIQGHNQNLLAGSTYTDTAALEQTLKNKTVALLFTKRSTRTRVASETSTVTLGGHPMFLGPSDIQLGVNESLYDTAKVVGSMVDGIMARVDGHEDVELLAKHAGVPIINALSDLYHPTQILADLLTMVETFPTTGSSSSKISADLSSLAGLKVAWVGDSNNILNDMLVSFPRLGIHLSVATPKGYDRNERVWGTMQDGIQRERKKGGSVTVAGVEWTNDPKEAVKDADIIVTDTWISMGEEASKEQRLRDFSGFQVTESLAKQGGAKSDWKFMHCLPRKSQEVDDQVFYGGRSIVFPEAENRKWTIMAVFDAYMGRWQI